MCTHEFHPRLYFRPFVCEQLASFYFGTSLLYLLDFLYMIYHTPTICYLGIIS